MQKIAPNWTGIVSIAVVGILAGVAMFTGHVELATALAGMLGGIVLPQPHKVDAGGSDVP